MSRWIEGTFGGKTLITIADMNECKYMYDDICCNDESEHCCCYAFEDDCKGCELFEKEDGAYIGRGLFDGVKGGVNNDKL